MRKEQYKAVIIGFAHVHINDVAQHFFDNPRIDLAACADIRPRVEELRTDAPYTRQWNMKYCAERFGLKVYEDWIRMLDEEKPDLAVCNSENCWHVLVTQECAKRHIAVCIEKPMATSLSDALQMTRLAETYDSTLFINWPITWYAAMHTAKKLLDEGAIGDLIEIKTRMGHTGPLGPGAKHKIDAVAAPMTDAEIARTWWHQQECGGGAMADYCCYRAKVAYWFAGKEAVAATGMRINSIHTLANAEDNAAMIVRFPDCHAVLEGTWTTYQHTFKSPILYGTKGAIVADYKTNKVQLYREFEPVQDVENIALPDCLKDVSWAYVHYMDGDAPLHETMTPRFNLSAIAILDAGIRSADSGKTELVNNSHWAIG